MLININIPPWLGPSLLSTALALGIIYLTTEIIPSHPYSVIIMSLLGLAGMLLRAKNSIPAPIFASIAIITIIVYVIISLTIVENITSYFDVSIEKHQDLLITYDECLTCVDDMEFEGQMWRYNILLEDKS